MNLDDFPIILLKSLLLPPGSLVLLLVAGLLLVRRKIGYLLLTAGTLGLALLSLPGIASMLLAGLEPYPALDLQRLPSDAQAIVVLAAGRYRDAPEYAADVAGPMTMARLRYAALLQKRTGLPLYVSGGSPDVEEGPPLAALMRQALEQEFGVPVAEVETRSGNTWENAQLTAALLKPLGIQRILLVTHAWHLPRAVYAFQRANLSVTPAPTAFGHRVDARRELSDWLPTAGALRDSYFVLHEYLGLLWYRLRNT